jgi:hypothetical protein
MQFSLDQILKMAPDEASAKAGQQLANNAKWVLKCIHPQALWGDCQGSGKTPYKTIVDLGNIAFKCSCPSRKFPCKHGLGLLILYAKQPDVFSAEDTLPPHVSEWLQKREAKEVTKEAAKETKEDKPVDEAARAKRADSREKKVNNGIEELRFWIKDVVRTGISNVPQNVYQFNQNITARMVDAQANGLANQLRLINKIDYYNEGWQQALIKRLAKIYLITEAYQQKEKLPASIAQELQTLIGWTIPKEEVLQNDAIKDTWIILSITQTDDGNIQTERIWMYGLQSKQFALLLNFYAGNQRPQHMLYAGLHLNADVVYFPALIPLRALIKEHQPLANTTSAISCPDDINTLFEKITAQLSQNPFTEQVPFVLEEMVMILKDDGTWWIKDKNNQGIAIYNATDECWLMMAFSKGKTFSFFGVYENETVEIHALWTNDKKLFLK